MELEPAPIGIEDLCRNSLRMIKEDAQRKRLDVQFSVLGVQGLVVLDARRVRQVLLNLLSNAVKFTPEGGAVRLEVAGDAAHRQLLLTVRDTGIGIEAKHLDELFQPFRQLDARLSRQFEGTGLGLALVRKLALLQGGDVEVQSEPGRGSRFTVRLPWVPAREQADEQDSFADAGGADAHREDRPLVLLAEDNDVNARVTRDYLRAQGFEVVVAGDGEEALRLAEEHTAAAIVMDIQLPVMDGLEVIRRLRADARWRGVPILALTALAMPGDRERCLEAGADDYLPKPVSLQQLVAFLRGRSGSPARGNDRERMAEGG